jgi:hypothetical protein
MAGQFRFKNNSGTVVAQISASNAGAISFSGSAVDFSSVATLTLGTSTLTGTASFAVTSSNAMTASSADTLYVRNNITTLGSITAQTLVVQTVTSSVLFSTGSNKLGNSLSNVQELTGSVGITGSLSVITTGTEFQVNAGGVNIGNALTDSHIISGSVTINPNGLFVSSSGNVGIGTTSTSYKLDIRGTQDDSTNFLFNGLNIVNISNQGGVPNKTAIRLGVQSDSGIRAAKIVAIEDGNNTHNIALAFNTNNTNSDDSTTERMRITSAGNVGIGTSSPGNFNGVTFTGPFFDVAGVMQIKGTSANTVAILQFGGDTYRKATIVSSIGTEDPYLAFGTASSESSSSSSERMRINSAGNIGIGTSTVTSSAGWTPTLVLNATSAALIIKGINGQENSLGTSNGFYVDCLGNSTASNNNIIFRTSNTNSNFSATERMRINSGGGVIINAPAAATGMYVNGKDNYWVSEMKAGGTNNQSFGLKIMASTNTSDTAISINNAADNLNLLKIRGGDGYTQIYGVYYNTAGSSANVFVSSDGGVQRSTASSLRYKENINEWSGNGLSTILALNPKTFTYKSNYYSNPERQFLGLIAEEVAEVSSYLADYENEDKTGQVENVRYANIVVPLIAAIKEQQSQIEELKAEIDILKQT